MSVQLISASTVPAQPWRNGGGITRELLAWPSAADWQLRISLADVHADGPFSSYPGVQRYFTVVAGAGVVLDFDADVADVRELPKRTTMTATSTPLHFDGALAPACQLIDGPTLDLNLMWRAGSAHMAAAQVGVAWQAEWRVCAFFSRVAGVWRDGSNSRFLPARSLIWQQMPAVSHLEWEFQPDSETQPTGSVPNTPIGWWLGWREENT